MMLAIAMMKKRFKNVFFTLNIGGILI